MKSKRLFIVQQRRKPTPEPSAQRNEKQRELRLQKQKRRKRPKQSLKQIAHQSAQQALKQIVQFATCLALLAAAPGLWGDSNLPFAPEMPLSAKEEQALLQAEGYLHGTQYPYRKGHRVLYLYGAGQPVLVCSPLNICLIELEAGEKIKPGSVHLGDQARWQVSPSMGGGDTTHLVVKPTDVGLATSMAIVTDRRTYYLRLVSRLEDHMPAIAWVYPGKLETKLEAFYLAQEAQTEARLLVGTGEDISNLDFNYTLSGCNGCPWRPLRVYNNGTQTIIQLGRPMAELEVPALLVVSGNTEGLANYRLRGNRYVVDHVFDEAILVAGVGRGQGRVSIKRRQLP